MKLKKELVDELISLSKKHYETKDAYIVSALFEAEDALRQNGKVNWDVVDLIGELAIFTQRSGKGTYEDIYKALAIFGVIVE